MEFDYISNKELFVAFARAWLKVASLETTIFPVLEFDLCFREINVDGIWWLYVKEKKVLGLLSTPLNLITINIYLIKSQ